MKVNKTLHFGRFIFAGWWHGHCIYIASASKFLLGARCSAQFLVSFLVEPSIIPVAMLNLIPVPATFLCLTVIFISYSTFLDMIDPHWTMARNGVPLVAAADVGVALPAGGLPLPFAALGRTTLWLWLWFCCCC